MLDDILPQDRALSFDAATAAMRGARDFQEDSIVSNFPLGQNSGYGFIADGMGGHAAGKVASDIVAAEMFSHLKMRETDLDTGVLNVPGALREAANAANQRVKARTEKDEATQGMGSTLLGIVVRNNRLSWVSVGDSPLYLFRGGALRQLNKDHSMAPQIDMLVKVGSLDEETARNHPDRNTLASVVSGNDIPMMDCPKSALALVPDDIIIAATDGLQFLPTAQIANTLMTKKDGRSIDIVDALVANIEELDHPEQDNATFLVIKMNEPREEAAVMSADDLPVLAMAHAEPAPAAPVAAAPAAPAPTPAPAPAPAAQAEASEPERKSYWYRGRQYFKD